MTKKLPEKLADALMNAGLIEMALAAREYRFHDFRSPLPDPASALAHQLLVAMRSTRDAKHRATIHDIYAAHMNGEWDATAAESDDWAKGPEGQDAFRRLMRGE